MSEKSVRVIWEDREGNRSRLYGGVDTTFSAILKVWTASGKHPNEFNALIVGAKVKPHLLVSCILWCSGYEVGNLFQGLRDSGLCKEVPRR